MNQARQKGCEISIYRGGKNQSEAEETVSVCTFFPKSLWYLGEGSSGGSEGHLEGPGLEAWDKVATLAQQSSLLCSQRHFTLKSKVETKPATLKPCWVPPRISVAGWMEVGPV